MGERGKRSRSHHDDRDNKHQRRRTERDRKRDDKGNDDEEIVYRILCPDNVIGSVIGKSGKVINSIRHDSGATIKVVDPFPGSKLRVITIYCYVEEKLDLQVDDEFNDIKPLCPAQDALLKMHAAIENAITSASDSDRGKYSRDGDRGNCQLLVPSSQCANIIGRSGSTIKKLRQNTRTNINVTAKDASDPSHSCAFDFDNFVAISGDSEAVKKSLFAISAIMYKFSPKENIPLETSVTEAPPSIIIPSDVPIYTGLYPSMDPIAPQRAMPSLLGSSHAGNYPSYADAGPTFPVYSSDLPVVSSYGGGSRSEELTIKVLCPTITLGRVIGKGGGSIKSIRKDSGARVDVVDRKTNDKECVITVISTETMEDVRSSAVEAVLLLQGKMNEEDDNDVVTMRLLVPSKVIGCVIGRNGSIINEIRKRTKAEVRISKGDTPKCADVNDELVEVSGEVGSVRDALIQIVLRLRMDVLTDREESRPYSSLSESRYSGGGASMPMPSVLPTLSSGSGLGYEPRAESGSGLGLLSSSAYGYRHMPVRSLPVEDNVYSLSSRTSSFYDRLPAPSALEMVIPAHAVGKVMGKGGLNVDNIRKISGASVDISEAKSSRGDRVALISGTSDQKRTAENLIQAFIMST